MKIIRKSILNKIRLSAILWKEISRDAARKRLDRAIDSNDKEVLSMVIDEVRSLLSILEKKMIN